MRWARGGSVNFPGESQGTWFEALVPLGLKALALDPPSDVCFPCLLHENGIIFVPALYGKCENNKLISVKIWGKSAYELIVL